MRNYAGTCKGICCCNLVHNFDIVFAIKIQFLWCTFHTHFGMESRLFQRAVLRMNCSSPCNYSFAIQLIQRWKNVFTSVIIKIIHSCRTCVIHVALVPHSCRSCSTRVVRGKLFSHLCHSCRTRVTRVWQLCCKIVQIS